MGGQSTLQWIGRWAVVAALALGACSAGGGSGGSGDDGGGGGDETPLACSGEVCISAASASGEWVPLLGMLAAAANEGGVISDSDVCPGGSGSISVNGTWIENDIEFTAVHDQCALLASETAEMVLTGSAEVTIQMSDGVARNGTFNSDELAYTLDGSEFTCVVDLDINLEETSFTGTMCGETVDGTYGADVPE